MNTLRRAVESYRQLLDAGAFAADENGSTVFYPSGILGRGYEVTAEQESAIRRFLRRFNLLVVAIAIVGASMFGLGTLLALPPLLAAYWIWTRRVTAGLPVSPMRMTSREAGRRAVRILGLRSLVVVLLISVAMTAASIALALSPTDRIVGLLGILLFGFSTYRFLSLLVRNRHEPAEPKEPSV